MSKGQKYAKAITKVEWLKAHNYLWKNKHLNLEILDKIVDGMREDGLYSVKTANKDVHLTVSNMLGRLGVV